MKTIYIAITLLFVLSQSFSQTNYDKRLLAIYSKKTLDKYSVEQPGKIRWENYKISHMYKYLTLQETKNIKKIDTLKLFDHTKKEIINNKIDLPPEKEFNPFLYNIEWKAKENTYYLVPDKNIVIEIFSKNKVISNYNKTIE
jgi:hypothetical protein